jgi:dimethylargininase
VSLYLCGFLLAELIRSKKQPLRHRDTETHREERELVHEQKLSFLSAYQNAIVRSPSRNFAAGLTTSSLGVPIYERAIEQHEEYCCALERCGLSVVRLEADERYPDSTFVEDTAVLVPWRDSEERDSGERLAILTRPGASSRLGEVESIRDALVGLGFRLAAIEAPGTVDGGDICQASNRFFIGISERTNESGAEQLSKLLSGLGYRTTLVDIRKLQGLLHLKSGIAYLNDQSLVITEGLKHSEIFNEYQLIGVPLGEEYGANCLCINDHVLVAAGHPQLTRVLKDHGYRTIELEMSEFQKMDGGLSCLSLRF